MLEENHYYPFGLAMAGISDKALKTNYAENKYKYNGIEYDSTFGLDEYEAHYRDLDPQTGRWWQVDPKTEGYENISPYASMYDDPVAKSDPLGDEAEEGSGGCCKNLFEAVVALDKTIINLVNPDRAVEGVRQVVISAGGTMGGMLNTVTAGAYPTDPAGTLGIPSETNASATMMGQFGGMFIDPLTGGPNIHVAPADGVSLIANPSSSISPGLPTVKVNSNSTTEPYKRPSNATTPEQRKSVQDKPCAKCGAENGKRIAGHKKALVKEHYENGSIDKKKMRSLDAVQPECSTCSAKEGAEMSKYSKEQKKKNAPNQ